MSLLKPLQTNEAKSYFPVLNGVRVLSTLWIVTYHITVQAGMFSDTREWLKFWAHPIFLYTGFIRSEHVVDIFFILTGFLLAHPIFWAEKQRKPSDPPLPRISVKQYLAQRMSRIYPAYLFAIVLYTCFLNNPITDVNLSFEKMPSRALELYYKKTYDANATHLPTGREAVPAHLLFINNLIPFGGCMMVTWSLCIQVQFYALFPILINRFGRGAGLIRVLLALMALSLAWRWLMWDYILAPLRPLQQFALTADDLTKVGTHFVWWYASSSQRIPCVLFGVLLAYALVNEPYRSAFASLNRRPLVRILLLALASYIAVKAVTIDINDKWSMFLCNVGGPLSLLAMCYFFALVLVGDGIGPLGRFWHWLLSLKLWALLSLPTYTVYLVHMSFTMRFYQSLFWPLTHDFPHLLVYILVIQACSWTVGVLVHLVIERPVDNCLKKERRTRVAIEAEAKRD